jgi:host factor-I protein
VRLRNRPPAASPPVFAAVTKPIRSGTRWGIIGKVLIGPDGRTRRGFSGCSPELREEGCSMEKQAQNIQEAFLNNARKDKTFLTIYLMSGVKLSGRIKSFDKYSVILETNQQEQLIFKHAISTVVVSKPFHTPVHSSAAIAGTHAAPGAPISDGDN